jgi:hypothetical protein
VLTAFVLLGVFAVLAVGFGLAVSSATANPTVAVLVTLPLSVALSLFVYFSLGVGLSVLAHDLWPGVAQGAPVWLPTAYVRADFGLPYFIYLILVPVAATAILATFFYEVTVSNLSDASDDRSSGIKRWFLFAMTTLVVVCLFGVGLVPSAQWTVVLIAMGQCVQFALFALFVLASDPPGPSRRVLAQWQKSGASVLRRFLGPGIGKTALLLVVVLAASLGIFFATGLYYDRVGTAPAASAGLWPGDSHTEETFYFAAYALAFYGFLAGLTVSLRSQEQGRFSVRAILALVTFAAFTVPLFMAGILKVAGTDKSAFSVAAPSPLFVFAMIAEANGKRLSSGFDAAGPGMLAVAFWATLGFVLGASGARRASQRAAAQELAWKALDARISSEAAEEEAFAKEPPAATAGTETAS